MRGAQKWVGRSRWNYGSYHLWGDVPALMPMAGRSVMKPGVTHRSDGSTNFHGVKASGLNWSDRTKRGQDFTRVAGNQAIKNAGGSWFRVAHNTTSGKGNNPTHTPHFTNPSEHGIKCGGDWFRDPVASCSSGSISRKRATALISKIPLPLSRYIARVYYPRSDAA